MLMGYMIDKARKAVPLRYNLTPKGGLRSGDHRGKQMSSLAPCHQHTTNSQCSNTGWVNRRMNEEVTKKLVIKYS